MQLEDVVRPLEVFATLRNRDVRPLKHLRNPVKRLVDIQF